ncbi:T9SS type A sorting domain-containing protein [candidate division KSB1 bacterium]|nr:T9SS type A sorting domain-containing protein [candidate division KSB1 bacterium]
MSRRLVVFAVLSALLLVSAALASKVSSKLERGPAAKVGDGMEVVAPESAPQNTPYATRSSRSLDLVGEYYEAGTTWYDYQHNGTAGHMIGVDQLGYVQVVWMNGLNAQFNPRHAYWNIWDPATLEFGSSSGSQVNASTRAGYVAQVTNADGWSFPTFHEVTTGDPFMGTAIDFLPGSGAFTVTQPTHTTNGGGCVGGAPCQTIWPKIDQGPDGNLHVVTTEGGGGAGDPQWIFYSRGVPEYDEFDQGVQITWQDVYNGEQYMPIEQVMTIAPDVAASPWSNRVAIAYLHPRDPDFATQWNNDLYLLVSEDGGVNWNEPINVTNFPEPDFDCASGDSLVCNLDTFRLYTDCNVMFDHLDNIHVAFTTRAYFGVGGYGNAGPFTWIDESGIWHWSEEYEEFTPIVNAYYFQTIQGGTLIDVGAWQLNAQRPCLAEDTITHYFYCSYQLYDSNSYSDQFFPMGDAYVSVSCDGGRFWSEATNVTETDGGQSTPPPGSLSERDITVAKYVTYAEGQGYLHMEYVLDHDAGGIPQDEGVATLNPVVYQRIPIADIALRPLVSPYWPALHVDSTGFPGAVVELDTSDCPDAVDPSAPTLRPESFKLYQNYPNPFNPNTKILFELARDAHVSLKVYNVAGQVVATLYDDAPLSAGVRTADFSADQLASGVYMYRLDVAGQSVTKKMVLMK